MRNFRMEKLAGFMKMAKDGKLTIANDTAFDVTLNQSGIPKDTVLKPGSTVLLGSTNNIDISWEYKNQSRSVTVDQAKLNSFLQEGLNTKVTLTQLSDEFEPKSAAPQAASAGSPADDGHKRGASLNKKFIKAATLRRLKIRSQMEAAIDSSAQMGRARVY